MDNEAIAAVSPRQIAPTAACSAVLPVGKLQRAGTGWVADWIFVDKGKVLSKWQTTHPDARRAMAGGADGAADALFKRYAKAGSGGPPGRYRVRILGIDSADDYLRLAGYLEGVSLVKRVTPVSATPDLLELDLELATGIANFAKYADRGDVLSTVSAGGTRDPGDDGESTAPQVATFRLD